METRYGERGPMVYQAGRVRLDGGNETMSQSTRDGGSVPIEVARLPESERHRLLASEPRRRTLDVLLGRTSPIELEELAASVAARGTESDAAEHLALRLHHVHLPMMDEAGIIDYAPEANRIESGPDRLDS